MAGAVKSSLRRRVVTAEEAASGVEMRTDQPTVRKSDKRAERTQQALVDALRGLMSENKGEISVKALTERAGITRKTFYLHYKTLHEFTDSLLSVQLDRVFTEAERDFLSDGRFDFLKFYRYLDALTSRADPFYLILAKETDILALLRKELDKRSDRIARMFGGDPSGSEDPVYYYLYSFCSGVYSMFFRWVDLGKRISIEEIAEASERMFERVRPLLRGERK